MIRTSLCFYDIYFFLFTQHSQYLTYVCFYLSIYYLPTIFWCKHYNPSLAPNISEYKIGHTTYIVETHFNLGCKETLDDIIKRLISRDVDSLQFVA